jgi:hypothetical protein
VSIENPCEHISLIHSFFLHMYIHLCVQKAQARSHLHSAGPRPFCASSIVWSSSPHMCENSPFLETNLTIPGHLSHKA